MWTICPSTDPRDYLDVLASDLEFASVLDYVPIARFNVAPGTRVLLLNQRNDKLHLDPLEWGYVPDWWREMKRQPVINARVETAASSGRCKPDGELVSKEFNKTFSHFLITVAFIKLVRSDSSFTA